MRRLLAITALFAVCCPAPALPPQGAGTKVEPAASRTRPPHERARDLFYRAFFVDRGLEQKAEALALYHEILQLAPQDPIAAQAARNAIQILRDSDRDDEARTLAEKHAAVMAETVPAGINASFLDPDADVSRFVDRFEAESREVFKNRHRVLERLALRPGQVVADVGAGTGLFTNLFARAVGGEGRVYAVDISPVMVAHIARMRRKMKLPQIEVVRCDARSSKLPAAAVDLVFICDTYHHFEHPADTLASIHTALRPGGQLVVIDFDRIPGVTRPWLLDHVRAGREVFRAEIEAAGFRLVRETKPEFFEENYLLRFEKPKS